MPYNLIKIQRGWKVIDDKGRFYSKRPLTKKMARLQQKALYAAENRRLAGGALANGVVPVYIDNQLFLVGDGWLSDAFARVKQTAKKAFSAVATPILTTVANITSRGIRTDYPPKVRDTLARLGAGTVYDIQLIREPIQSFIDRALNFISLGKWNEAKRNLNYDKLFHLSMIARLAMPDGNQVNVKIEKNEVINVTDQFASKERSKFQHGSGAETETYRVPVPCCITLQEMMDRASHTVGESFFRYDAFTNNCQIFINNILTANGLATPQISAWILQPTDQLLMQLPKYMSPFARLVTNIAGLADLAIEGRGEIIGTGVPIRPKFRRQLRKIGISPEQYLKTAREMADESGYDSRALEFSDTDDKKLRIWDDDGKAVHFGAVGYNDFILWSFLEQKGDVPSGQALKKRNVFQRSHSKIKGDWKRDKFSPNSLALAILW
jgi:hypothetical protein